MNERSAPANPVRSSCLSALLLSILAVSAMADPDGEPGFTRVKQIGELNITVHAIGEATEDMLTVMHREDPGNRAEIETVNGIVVAHGTATGPIEPDLWSLRHEVHRVRDRLHMSFNGNYKVKVWVRRDGQWDTDPPIGQTSVTMSGGGNDYKSAHYEEIKYDYPNRRKHCRTTDTDDLTWTYSTPEIKGDPIAFRLEDRDDGNRWYNLQLNETFFWGFERHEPITRGRITKTVVSNDPGNSTESEPLDDVTSTTTTLRFAQMFEDARWDKSFLDQLTGPIELKGKPTTVVRTAHTSRTLNEPVEANGVVVAKRPQTARMEVTYSIAMNVQQSPVEVEIIPEAGYDQWLPEAGTNEITGGNTISAKVRLVRKDDKSVLSDRQAKFKFQLLDTSRQPGVCCNRPKKEAATDNYDFKIEKAYNSLLDVTDEGQSAETVNLGREAEITVTSMDWGAFANLQVTAFTDDGQIIIGHLKDQPDKSLMPVPRDDNNNYIADAWEKEWNIYDRSLAPEWNGSEEPKDQRADGDGLALYEKYRGFFYRIYNARQGHKRLDPHRKYLFVYDPEMIMAVYDSVRSFAQASKLKILYIDPENWTGQGSSSAGKRIVNFNHDWGHAVDQHAVHVSTRSGETPTPPYGWQEQMAKTGMNTDFETERRIEGISFPDGTTEIGPPVNVYEIILYPTAIDKGVDSIARLCLFHAEKYNAARNGADDDAALIAQWKAHYEQLQADKLAYDSKHPTEGQQAFERKLAIAICHEFGHSTCAQHHEVDAAKGERRCYMIQNDLHTPPPLPSDPYYLRPELPEVHIFCRDRRFGADGRGCFEQILVNDDPKARTGS